MPVPPSLHQRWAGWCAQRRAALEAAAAARKVPVNLHPWTQPETAAEELARVTLGDFPSMELAVTLLHHGLTGQEPLSVSRIADRLGRSFMEVGATLHAADMRARNNDVLRAGLQPVVEEIAESVLEVAEALVALRTSRSWSAAKEERLVKTWFFARKPIQRFALSALWDGPVAFACALMERRLAALSASKDVA